MAVTTADPNQTSMIKRLIGIALLLIGAWVAYDGWASDETVTLILGVASLIGGICFLLIRPRHVT